MPRQTYRDHPPHHNQHAHRNNVRFVGLLSMRICLYRSRFQYKLLLSSSSCRIHPQHRASGVALKMRCRALLMMRKIWGTLQLSVIIAMHGDGNMRRMDYAAQKARYGLRHYLTCHLSCTDCLRSLAVAASISEIHKIFQQYLCHGIMCCQCR